MDTKNYEQQAKSILKKHRITVYLSCIVFLAAVFCYSFFLPALIPDFGVRTLLLIALLILYVGFILYLSTKDIMFPLILHLNAPLHYEIVKQGKLFSPSAVQLIQAEYFVGNYANVIRLCNQKLNDQKAKKNWKYFYLAYLAKTYFDLGEEERLREICDRFYQLLSTDKKREKILKRFEDIPFFSVYVNRNLEACEQYANKPQKFPVQRMVIDFLKARLALLKGETEEARKGFEKIIAEAPLLHLATLSKLALEGMENGTDYRESVAPILEKEITEPLKPSAATPALNVFNKVLGVLMIVIAVFVVIAFLLSKVDWSGDEAYKKEIEAIVEVDYDGVEVLEFFDLYKDDFWVDAMFICKTNDSVLIGSIYYYEDDYDDYFYNDYETYYEVQAEIPLSNLMADDFIQITNLYESVTEYCSVTSGFYANEADVPVDHYYFTSFVIDGKTVYFAVLDVQFEDWT